MGPIGLDFCPDPDLDSGKKVLPMSGQRTHLKDLIKGTYDSAKILIFMLSEIAKSGDFFDFLMSKIQ